MLQQKLKMKNGETVLYIALILIVITLMVALHRCGSGKGGEIPTSPTGSAHSGGDTIDVAIEYSPRSYYTYNDTLGGFNYDLLRLIAKHSGRPMKFHSFVTLSLALDGLDKGLYDLLAGQFPMTTENKSKYLFTKSVYLDKQVLVQRILKNGDIAIKSQLDLAKDTVHVVKGSPMLDRVKRLSREIGDTIHVAVDSIYGPEQLFLRVVTGEIKYAVINERIAQELHKSYNDRIDISKNISFSQFQSWALKKGNITMCQFFNSQLQALQASGAYGQLARRYHLETQVP